MITYIMVTNNGEIVRSGTCQEEVEYLLDVPKHLILVKGIHANPGSSEYYNKESGKIEHKAISPGNAYQFDYATKEWIFDISIAWQSIRSQRDQLLSESDWTQLPDVPSTLKASWVAYRQALRDVTLQLDPTAIVWPVKES